MLRDETNILPLFRPDQESAQGREGDWWLAMRPDSRFSILLVLFLGSTALLHAQESHSPCEMTPLTQPRPGANMFTPQQETDLGDIIAQENTYEFRPIEDAELSRELSQVGDRMVKHLPASGLTFRFYVSDAPVANAWSIVGGRVYLTRKIIGLFRNEDEMAGVIGHELGHIVTHEQAKLYTRLFREQLNVNEVTDRKDILDKYNRLLDEWRKHAPVRRDSEADQQEADRTGLEASVRAGYSPQALADFWDRFTENKGRTGTWFSDFLESTPPEAKRYREMIKGMGALPSECKDKAPAAASESFRQWQLAAVNYRGLRSADNLHNLVWKKTLEPPLQDAIHTLKFSPDGRYVLAQDSGNIYVLAHEPFQVLFRIDAYDAYPARFTPDSKAIVFSDPSLRIEKWDVASQERISVNEAYVYRGCWQTALSPDGNILACYRSTKELELVDVTSGDHLLERKNFLEAKASVERSTLSSFRFTFTLDLLNLAFSPDGRYFVAGLRNQNNLAFDVAQRQEIPVPNALKPFLGTAFGFITPDRIIGYLGDHGEKSAIVEFPSGKVIRQLDLGGARPTPATHGNYVLIRPIKDYAVGILDVASNQIVGAYKEPALDLFDKQYVAEMKNGHIGLFGASPAPLAEAVLPRGSFGRLRSEVVSDDMNWLAASSRARGGVWAVSSGSRILNLREFRGAYIGPDGALLADFPPHDSTPRSIARILLDQRQFSEAMKPVLKDARQEGPYLVSIRQANEREEAEKEKDKETGPDTEDSAVPPVEGANIRWESLVFGPDVARDTVLEVRQIQSGSLLWSRNFPKESPRRYANWSHNTLILSWPFSQSAAKAELNDHPDWKTRFPSPKEDDFLFEVLDLKTGNVRGGFVLSTGEGSFSISRANAAGDWLILQDNRDRVLVYSLGSGKEIGRTFGSSLVFSETSGLLCVQTLPGKIELYDLKTMSLADEFTFAHNISSVDFVANGRRLLVLTSDQTAYLLEPRGTIATR